MRNPDEDYAYGIRKQRRIDAMSVNQFQRGYGVQKFARKDPAPSIPFYEKPKPFMSKWEVFFYAIAWVFAIAMYAYHSLPS